MTARPGHRGDRKKVQSELFGSMTLVRMKRLAMSLYVAGHEPSEIKTSIDVSAQRIRAWARAGGWDDLRKEREEIYLQKVVSIHAEDQAERDKKHHQELLDRRDEMIERLKHYGGGPGQDPARALRAIQYVVERLDQKLETIGQTQVVGFEYIEVDNGPPPANTEADDGQEG